MIYIYIPGPIYKLVKRTNVRTRAQSKDYYFPGLTKMAGRKYCSLMDVIKYPVNQEMCLPDILLSDILLYPEVKNIFLPAHFCQTRKIIILTLHMCSDIWCPFDKLVGLAY